MAIVNSLMGGTMPTPSRTSLDAIVAAARDLVTSGGVDALTMQAVAEKVGVRAPSLYKRVRGRSALLRLVVEDALRELGEEMDRAADTGDPRTDLRALAMVFRSFAHAQPNVFGLLFVTAADAAAPDVDLLARASSPVIRTAERLAGPDDALPAARTITAWAVGFVQMELSGAFQLGGDVQEAFDYGIDRLAVAVATATVRT
jgi:AcrR family transcriptional regulator